MLLAPFLGLLLQFLPTLAWPAWAAPGICVGPVCADEIHRSVQYPWQLTLRLLDQAGRRERLLVDCRDGVLSPMAGPVNRGYAKAVAKRSCRFPVE